MSRLTGKVSWFNPTKGYGFIKQDGSDTDIFVHWTGIRENGKYRSLIAGQEVSFELGTNNRGEIAVDVVVTAEPSEDC